MFHVQIHSLSVTAELIGQNCDSAGFIYGAMTLTDKFANGLAVMAVQSIEPNFDEECNSCVSCHPFFAQVLFYACGGAALLGALAMLSLVPVTIGQGFRKEVSAHSSFVLTQPPTPRSVPYPKAGPYPEAGRYPEAGPYPEGDRHYNHFF